MTKIDPHWLEDASMEFEGPFAATFHALGRDWHLQQDGGEWRLNHLWIGGKRIDIWEAVKRAWKHIDEARTAI